MYHVRGTSDDWTFTLLYQLISHVVREHFKQSKETQYIVRVLNSQALFLMDTMALNRRPYRKDNEVFEYWCPCFLTMIHEHCDSAIRWLLPCKIGIQGMWKNSTALLDGYPSYKYSWSNITLRDVLNCKVCNHGCSLLVKERSATGHALVESVSQFCIENILDFRGPPSLSAMVHEPLTDGVTSEFEISSSPELYVKVCQ